MRSREAFSSFIENFYYFRKQKNNINKKLMFRSKQEAKDEGYTKQELDNAENTVINLIGVKKGVVK